MNSCVSYAHGPAMDLAPDRNDSSVEPVDHPRAIARDTAILRSQLRDLIAILALPALWSGQDAAHIAEALLDVLSSMLRLDLAYIRAPDPPGSGPSETVRVQGRPDLGSRGREIASRLAEGTTGIDANETLVLPDPATREPLRATRIALKLAGHTGVVVAASRRSGFPTSFELFLLRSIITEAEVALRNAALMTALHHALQREQVARADAEAANRAKDLLNEELERRVVERTGQLSLINQELRSENAERKRSEEALRESEQRFRLRRDGLGLALGDWPGPLFHSGLGGDRHARHRSRQPDRRDAGGLRHRRRGRAPAVAPACRDARRTPTILRPCLQDRGRRRIRRLQF